jgi:Holliday junction resolvasome RuvABC endonuclease subunit
VSRLARILPKYNGFMEVVMDRSKINNILVLDPAESTGYAVCKIDGDTCDIHAYGFIDVDKTSDYQGDDCIDLMNQVKELIEIYSIDYVAIEDYFFSGRFAQGSTTNAAYRTAIHILCRQLGIEYSILSISSWKKLVSGRTTPTKEQKAKWGKEAAKKLMIQEALWKNYGFRFPNHSLSKKTGKPIKFRYDIVDAVAQAVYFVRQHLDVQKVELSVTNPPDVEFKKKPRTMFEYKE